MPAVTTRNVILARVHRIVAGTAGPTRTPPDADATTPLGDDGFWLDSVDLVELVVACEKEFDVTFDDATDLTPATLRTVGSLADLISSKGAR